MRLIFVMNVYNEARRIRRAIESVNDVADEIWLYDGAYKEYPHESPISTDGTLEIAKEYPKVKIFDNNGEDWENQLVKRTAMFKHGKPGDYFFKLDGDEYITNPEIIREEILKHKFDVGWVWTLCNLYREPIMTARIFKYQPGLHYAGRHHWLFNGKKEFVTSDQFKGKKFKHHDTEIRLFNYRESSTPKRKDDKKGFLRERSKYELIFNRELEVYGKREKIKPHPFRAGKPSKPMKILREFDEDKLEYTFTLMFSRPWAVHRFFANLKKVRIPPNTEAIVVVDTDDRIFFSHVASHMRKTNFESIKMFFTGNRKLRENSDVIARRKRIINNWHILLTEATTDIILGAEDDSLPEPNAYLRLLRTMKDFKADFVQGNIIGRWRANMIPAWHIKEDSKGNPIEVNSGKPCGKVENIQGAGWYCFVAKTMAMRKFPMYVDDKIPLGPDVRFGYELWKAGFKLLHDYRVTVEHFGQNFSLIPGRNLSHQFTWIKKGNKWTIKE